jgi:hypothetical protein
MQGAFIPAGNAFDALAAVGKVLSSVKKDALIVDPYMDEKTLTVFAPMLAEGIDLRLLADSKSVKSSLAPAANAWTTQYAKTRPLELKHAHTGTLHDRLILVDHAEVWVLTQSLNRFAERAPASIVRVDVETAALKIEAYKAIWAAAT